MTVLGSTARLLRSLITSPRKRPASVQPALGKKPRRPRRRTSVELQLEPLETRDLLAELSFTFVNNSGRADHVFMAARDDNGTFTLPASTTDVDQQILNGPRGTSLQAASYDLFTDANGKTRTTTTFTVDSDVGGGRIFLAFGGKLPDQPLVGASDASVANLAYDFIEFAFDPSVNLKAVDLSQVDQFGFPLTLEVEGKGSVGFDPSDTSKTRDALRTAYTDFAKTISNVDEQALYQALLGDFRIKSPKEFFAFGGNRDEKYADIFNTELQKLFSKDGPTLTLTRPFNTENDQAVYTSSYDTDTTTIPGTPLNRLKFTTTTGSHKDQVFYVYEPHPGIPWLDDTGAVAAEQIFKCTGVFIGFKTGQPDDPAPAVLQDLQTQIVSALNRGIAAQTFTGYANTTEAWVDPENWYPDGTTSNLYSKFLHTSKFFLDNKAYGFPQDEGVAAPKFEKVPADAKVTITLGPWAEKSSTHDDVNGDGQADRVVAAGAGGVPHVQVLSGQDGSMLHSFLAFDPAFRGGVTAATGDVNQDGRADIVVGAGANGGSHVKVFSGQDGALLQSFLAFHPEFKGGVSVAAGDIDGDGRADIVVGAGPGGGPHVRVFSGQDGSVLRDFFAFDPRFTGGVHVAVGDINNDGRTDIIVGAGAGGAPQVVVFSGQDLSQLRNFMAYDTKFTGGVHLAAGDLNGDGFDDIVTGPGAGSVPQVQVYSGQDGSVLHRFLAFDAGFTGGVRLAVGDANGDGIEDIFAGAGAGGGPHVQVFDGMTLTLIDSFFAYGPSFTGGVHLGD